MVEDDKLGNVESYIDRNEHYQTFMSGMPDLLRSTCVAGKTSVLNLRRLRS